MTTDRFKAVAVGLVLAVAFTFLSEALAQVIQAVR